MPVTYKTVNADSVIFHPKEQVFSMFLLGDDT